MQSSTGNLTASQIKGYAVSAGFTGRDADIATAIAMAESGGNPRAHNAKPPDNSYGLWQINMIGSMGPRRQKAYRLPSNESLYDPATNARVAYSIFKARGSFKDWSTYNNGSYLKFMGTAGTSNPDNQVPSEGGNQGGLNDTNQDSGIAGAISQSFYRFTETIRMSAILFAVMWVAIIFLVIGFIILNRGRVAKVATVVGPGKVLKMAKAVA